MGLSAQLRPVSARLRAAGCVFAEEEAALLLGEGYDARRLEEAVARREAGEPLEHILGWVAFCGVRVGLLPGVFIPRRRSCRLVHIAAEVTSLGAVVLDLCCGSGALAMALAARVPGIELHAVDVDGTAVACARRNLGGSGSVYCGDLFAAVPPALRGRVDTVLANVPYVPTHQVELMPREAREYEPNLTHEGGADGLAVLRRVARDAATWVAPGGHVLVEVDEGQAEAAAAAFVAGGLPATADTSQEWGTTVVVAGPAVSGRRRSASR